MRDFHRQEDRNEDRREDRKEDQAERDGQAELERTREAGSFGSRLCVLVVGESEEQGARLVPLFARAGFTVRECADGVAGVDAFIRELPDLIVAHDPIVGREGIELIRRLREISDVPVVLVGQADSPGARATALRLGVDRYVASPRELESLPRLAVDLVGPPGAAGPAGSLRPRAARRPVTATHVRRAAQAALCAELERLLVACNGNLAEMARRMGKDRSTIRYHLRRFGMLAEESVVPSSVHRCEARRDPAAPA